MKKKKVYYKTVLLPIEVPHGDFCWGKGRACSHLDNEGGFAECTLNLGIGSLLEQNEEGEYPKPEKCLNLKNVSL